MSQTATTNASAEMPAIADIIANMRRLAETMRPHHLLSSAMLQHGCWFTIHGDREDFTIANPDVWARFPLPEHAISNPLFATEIFDLDPRADDRNLLNRRKQNMRMRLTSAMNEVSVRAA